MPRHPEKPSILVFDEATSALDSEPSRASRPSSIASPPAARTHAGDRSSPFHVMGCDQILVLDQGRNRRARHSQGIAGARRCLRPVWALQQQEEAEQTAADLRSGVRGAVYAKAGFFREVV